MKVNLAYGQGRLTVELPDSTTVIQPSHQPGLADERAAVLTALDHPIGAKPLPRLSAPEIGRIAAITTISGEAG